METTTSFDGSMSAHNYLTIDPNFNRLRFTSIFAREFPKFTSHPDGTRAQRERLFQCIIKYYWEGGVFPLSKSYKRCIKMAMSMGLPPYQVDIAMAKERRQIKRANSNLSVRVFQEAKKVAA